jgi:excisionase family DNA binding protein
VSTKPVLVLQPLLSVKDAAEQTGLSEWVLYDAIRKEQLPALRFGRRVRLQVTDVQAWIAEHLTVEVPRQRGV